MSGSQRPRAYAMRKAGWLVATAVWFVAVGGAQAASDPPGPDASAIASAAGISLSCSTAKVSDIDTAWSAVDDTLCGGLRRIAAQRTLGGWVTATEVAVDALPPCPVAPLPAPVGFELEVCRITRPVAEAIVDGFLTAKYPAWWPQATKRWVTCPIQEIIDDETGSWIICRFEMNRPGDVIGGDLNLRPRTPGLVDGFAARAYTKRPRRCHIAGVRSIGKIRLTARTLTATGLFSCTRRVGPAGMAHDLEAIASRRFPKGLRPVEVVAIHGTNQAGFDDSSVFRCKVRHSGGHTTATCANRVSDWFRYAFTTIRKTAAAPVRRPAPLTGPSGGGIPLQPDLPGDQDCSDFSGPVRVLPGDPDHLDRDGDGIGCDK